MKYALIFWVMTYWAGIGPIEVDRYPNFKDCETAAAVLRQEKIHKGKAYAVCVPLDR